MPSASLNARTQAGKKGLEKEQNKWKKLYTPPFSKFSSSPDWCSFRNRLLTEDNFSIPQKTQKQLNCVGLKNRNTKDCNNSNSFTQKRKSSSHSNGIVYAPGALGVRSQLCILWLHKVEWQSFLTHFSIFKLRALILLHNWICKWAKWVKFPRVMLVFFSFL